MACTRPVLRPWVCVDRCWLRGLSSSGAVAASDGLSVRQRLKQQRVPQDMLQRIRELGVSREKGKQADERRAVALRQMGRKRLGKMKLICTANALAELPTRAGAPQPELALAGRSNVGKSSLLNALVGRRGGASNTNGIAEVQNKPGVTKSLNFYANPAAAAAGLPGVRIVDMPGLTPTRYPYLYPTPPSSPSYTPPPPSEPHHTIYNTPSNTPPYS